MSTGADCRFIQSDDGQWTYELQQWPFGQNPNYDTYGPFELFSDAEEHLHDHHANPGGFSIKRSGKPCPHDVLRPLDKFERFNTDDTHECRRCGRWIKIDA